MRKKNRRSQNKVNSTNESVPTFAQRWGKVDEMLGKISTRSTNVNDVFKVLQFLSSSIANRQGFSKVISSLAKLNPPSANNKNVIANEHKPQTTGNDFYDIFNSPGMTQIIREVMINKRKKRK